MAGNEGLRGMYVFLPLREGVEGCLKKEKEKKEIRFNIYELPT